MPTLEELRTKTWQRVESLWKSGLYSRETALFRLGTVLNRPIVWISVSTISTEECEELLFACEELIKTAIKESYDHKTCILCGKELVENPVYSELKKQGRLLFCPACRARQTYEPVYGCVKCSKFVWLTCTEKYLLATKLLCKECSEKSNV